MPYLPEVINGSICILTASTIPHRPPRLIGSVRVSPRSSHAWAYFSAKALKRARHSSRVWTSSSFHGVEPSRRSSVGCIPQPNLSSMELKTCKKCNQQKPLDRFSTFKSRNGEERKRGECWDCRNQYAKDNFERLQKWRHEFNQQNKTKKQERAAKVRAEIKAYIDGVKSVPCMDCGGSFPPVCMDFDHIQPKFMSIAKMYSQVYKLDLIKLEIQKCEIVCANCHRLRTQRRKENQAPSKATLSSLPTRS